MKSKRVLLFSPLTILNVLNIGVIYVVLTVILINYRFLFTILRSASPLALKMLLFYDLFLGIFSAFGIFTGILLTINALLVGINAILLMKVVKLIHSNGKMKLSFGGLTILSLISTGCSACGISFLATLGLGSAFSFFPFFTTAITCVSALLLFFSAGYMIKKLLATNVCNL